MFKIINEILSDPNINNETKNTIKKQYEKEKQARKERQQKYTQNKLSIRKLKQDIQNTNNIEEKNKINERIEHIRSIRRKNMKKYYNKRKTQK